MCKGAGTARLGWFRSGTLRAAPTPDCRTAQPVLPPVPGVPPPVPPRPPVPPPATGVRPLQACCAELPVPPP
eukprot:1533250-Heterocapsa_arctica.AAC.1